MSRPDLSSFFVSILVWSGHRVILCFVLCVIFLGVWPGIVPNQRQLPIVVSD